MRYAETIIVGGGPAGSSCARELVRLGKDCLVLEAAAMPRVKLCAGWITPKVLEDLEFRPEEYPHGLITLKKMRICLGKKRRFSFNIPTLQYSIRRVEFDHWLLKRSGAEVIQHRVSSIESQDDRYLIDGKFECRFLVGAGGSGCPVQKSVFKNHHGARVIAKEIEYGGNGSKPGCTLWVPFAGKGYAWHIQKADAVNIGYGSISSSTEPNAFNQLWPNFVELLLQTRHLSQESPAPSGWFYRLRSKDDGVEVKRRNAYVVGDAAGLATEDMGEGIGPAIESGILAARDISGMEPYTLSKITRSSIPALLKLPRSVASPLQWILSKLL